MKNDIQKDLKFSIDSTLSVINSISAKEDSIIEKLVSTNKNQIDLLGSIQNFQKIISENSYPSELDKWANKTSIISAILSFLAILVTILFGMLTYRLAIKYGESAQEVKDLNKVINELKTQTSILETNISEVQEQTKESLTQTSLLNSQLEKFEEIRKVSIENSKPLLDITGVSFGSNEDIDPKHSKHTHKFEFKVTNFGGRSAQQLKASSFFFEKLGSDSIGRYNRNGFDEEYAHQSFLLPGETKSFKYPYTMNHEGMEQLNQTIVLFQLDYVDGLTGQNNQFKLFERFNVSNGEVKLYKVKREDIALVEKFIDNLSNENKNV